MEEDSEAETPDTESSVLLPRCQGYKTEVSTTDATAAFFGGDAGI